MLGSRTSQKFRNKRRNSRILFGVLILVSTALYFITLGNDDAFRKTRNNAEGVGAKVLTYLTLPVRGFENFAGGLRDRWNAHAENEILRQEITRLSDIEARANALTLKLSRFETILNASASSDIPETKIAARAVSEVNGPFARTALINVGVRQGISEGDAVMTVDGLFGHVVRAGNSSARVLKLEDLNSRIAVMSQSTQSRAILMGDNSPYPLLSYIAPDSDWSEGEIILTSGDDGILPGGLPVGRLVSEKNGAKKVDLFVNNSFVDWVWVYPYDPVEKPEDDPAAPQSENTEDDDTDEPASAPRPSESLAIDSSDGEPL